MAGRTGSAKKENAGFLLFGKIIKSTLSIFELIGHSIIYFIGRPAFHLLYYSLYTIPYALYVMRYTLFLIGNLVLRLIKLGTSIFQTIGRLLLKSGQIFFKIKLPRIKLPKLKIVLPRLSRKVIVSLSVLFSLFLALYLFYFLLLKDLPRPDKLITRDQIVSTKIYDRHGRLLYKIYRKQNRTLVKLEDIPLSFRQATISIEDGDFYSHPGFTIKGIVRAAFSTLFLGKLQGGSTITQQLVKFALLTPEKTLIRKMKEIILALQVETYFSKDEILQMYFNEVGYGGATYGAEEASQVYFGKSVRDLSLAESSLLAGLPKSPTKYSPFGAYPQLAKNRQKEVLRRMAEEGYITENTKLEVQGEKLVFEKPRNKIQAPHFVMYIKELLVEKYGEKMVEEGGLEIVTSLDLDIQKMAEKAVSEEIKKLRDLKVTNGAVLVTNPQTGEILAMVGSHDYFDLENDGNVNVTIMSRQPGSAIKVANYAYALSNGYTPATILSDTPIAYQIPGQPPYSPRNYDGKFHGNISLRTALASSYNVPAVKVLASYGVEKMIEQGEKMGITTWEDRSRFGLSLTLGGGEIKMSDLAVVYGVLANLGKRVDLNPILQVKDYRGKALDIKSSSVERALAPAVAYLLTDILSDNVARTPAFGANSLLNIPDHQVAVKTGTTQNIRDNWTIGYTPTYLVAAWVGNNDNTPMSWVASGITGATPIWHQVMKNLLKDKPNESFPKPTDLKRIEICSINGLLPCEGCPTKTEYFLSGTEPQFHCDPSHFAPDKTSTDSQDEEKIDQLLEGISTER